MTQSTHGRRSSSVVAPILIAVCLWSLRGMTSDQPPTQRTDTLRKYQLDPASSLESRVSPTPISVLKMFADAGEAPPAAHDLTADERRALSAAFAVLPPVHRRILGERLRTISFLDGIPNTALTSTVNPNEPYLLFDVTVRAGVFRETVSEFLTQKERSCFDTAGSSRNVFIEAGTLEAIVYVLLHEATHIVDSSLQISQAGSFTDGVWIDRTTPDPRYRDPLLERVKFRTGGEVLPIARAEALYAFLRRTPFASLYGSSNRHDDLADFFSWYHLTERLKQPYRIVIRDARTEVFAYEPMKSPLQRQRFSQMQRFYEKPQ